MRFVGSPSFLLILSGQAKYCFILFKGTSKPNQKQNKQKQEHIKKILKIKRRKTKENDHVWHV